MDIKRVLTSVIGMPAIILILIFGNTIIIDMFFAIVAVIAIKEFFDAFAKGINAKPVRWIGYTVALSIGVIRLFHLKSSLIDVDSDMMNIMFGLIVVSLFVVFFRVLNSGMKTTVVDAAITIFGIVYVPVFLMFLPMLIASINGKILIGYVFISSWVTDICAYLAGKVLDTKKHKFSKISPNKSIEGCISGTVGAVTVSILYTLICNTYLFTNTSYIYSMITVLILSVMAQIGDFAASSIKRYNNIKDFSNLIPGHGRNAR